MFGSVHVVGQGRAGKVIAARLVERRLQVTAGRTVAPEAELVLLAVPDSAIREVAAAIRIGPWVAHVSGATQLDALGPHARRFSVHPLQTLTTRRGPEQLDGAWAAVSGDDPEGVARGRWLAESLGLQPFEIRDADRVLYHAAAVIAGNYLVTLHSLATRIFERVGAPAEALVPFMERTIENGFELTGPIARGDWATVEAHLAALEEAAPDLAPVYRALADATRP